MGEGGGVLAGQRRPARRQAGVTAAAGGGDGNGVERPFNDDRLRSPGEPTACLPQAEQHFALPVPPCAGAVQVFGHVRAGAAGRAADEGDHGAVGGADGEHGAVAESVDEGSAPGPAAQPRRLDNTVAVAERPQMLDERRPLRGGVPGLQALLHRSIEAAVGQVAGDPAAGQPAAEEPRRAPVNLGELST